MFGLPSFPELKILDFQMKSRITPVSEEILRRKYPICGLVTGWCFRQKEVSNGGWLVEGKDVYGREVSRGGVDPDMLLKECVIWAKKSG